MSLDSQITQLVNHPTSNSLADPELLDLKLGDSNAVLRVLREMVDVRLLVNPRFLLIWNGYPPSILRPGKE